MIQKYFVARDGVQKGPWTLQEITQHIQDKDISWNDYIYDEKHDNWMFLFEFCCDAYQLYEGLGRGFIADGGDFRNCSPFIRRFRCEFNEIGFKRVEQGSCGKFRTGEVFVIPVGEKNL